MLLDLSKTSSLRTYFGSPVESRIAGLERGFEFLLKVVECFWD